MVSQYDWDMLIWVIQQDYWILVLGFLLMAGYMCWTYGRLAIFIYLLPVVLLFWGYFEATGHFSQYGRTIRAAAILYSQDEYSNQIDTWVKEVKDNNGKWVSMVSCPWISDNGTEGIWVEFAYQDGKMWYEPSYLPSLTL
jgi:hypothetical protein